MLSLFVMLGAAALAVDAGSMWMTKRNFIADTDAAALAAAMHAAESGCDVTQSESEAEAYLAHNQGGSVAGASSVTVDCTANTVTVDYTGQAPMTFAGALGYSQLDVFSSSTASFSVDGVSQLRPLATCIDNPMVAAAGETAATEDITFNSPTTDLTTCGSSPSNWGWICIADKNCEAATGGSGGEYPSDLDCSDPRTILGFLRCGFPDSEPKPDLRTTASSTSPYEIHDEDCTAGAETETVSGESPPDNDWCWTKPGVLVGEVSGAAPEGYDRAIDVAYDQRVFPVLLLDRFLSGSDGRTVVHPKALLYVEFNGYCFNQTPPLGYRDWEADPSACNGAQFILQLKPLHVQWGADDPLPGYVTAHMPTEVGLCGVDHDPAGGNRC